MIDKRKLRLSLKLTFVLILGIIILLLLPFTFSRYFREAESEAKVDIAFYLLDATYQTDNIKLLNMIPRPEPYVFTFTIANFRDDVRSDIDLEYEIELRTTTNIPLQYVLHRNHIMNNIIINSEIINDNHGTFFKIMQTNPVEMRYQQNNQNTYTLFVTFSLDYDEAIYQNLIESIQINIRSKQIID